MLITFLKADPDVVSVTFETPTIIIYKGNEAIGKSSGNGILECLKMIRQQFQVIEGNRPASFRSHPSQKSISAMDVWWVSATLNLNIVKLLCSKKTTIEQMIQLRVLSAADSDQLFDSVYNALIGAYDLRDNVYTHIYVKEDLKRTYVLAMLRGIKKYMQAKHKINDKSLKFEIDEVFETDLLGRDGQVVKADVSVYKELKVDQPANQPCGLLEADESKRRRVSVPVRKWFFSIMECKVDNPDKAVKQCVGYCAAAIEENRKTEAILGPKPKQEDPKSEIMFGFCSNGTEYSLLTYEAPAAENQPPVCELSPTYSLMFPLMFKPENIELWKLNYTKIILVIYTILCNYLGI